MSHRPTARTRSLLIAAAMAAAAVTAAAMMLVPIKGYAEGVRIHHELHRQGTPGTQGTLRAGQPLVVLIHGWSCDSSYWRAQIPALVADYDVVTIDLAGHGASASDRDDFSMRSFGEDVQRVIDSLPGDSPLILVGHSMGGPVAVEAARLLGNRVRAVIGVDTFSTVGLPAPPAAETEMRIGFFAKDFAAATRMFVDRTFFKPDADPELRGWIVEDMARGDARVGIAALRGLNAWNGAEAIPSLAVPVIAINSDLSRTDETRIRAIAPNFSLVEVAGPGHFLMMEQPQRFNALLLAELARLR